jgi:drug/metabolite transporter (DMT)-like permease
MVDDPQLRHERRVEVLLLLVVVVWASNYPLAKYALRELSPLLFNAIRYTMAMATLAIPFLAGGSWKPIAREDRWPMLRAGIIASVVYQMAFIYGLSMTTAGNSAILLSTSPLWTIILNAKMHKEKVRRTVWAGMLTSLLGVALIIAGSGKKLEFGGRDLLGDAITLGAAALWGLNTTLQRPLLTKYPSNQLAFVLIAIGAVGLSAIALPLAPAVDWGNVHWTSIVATLVSGALSIGVANLIWSHGVKHLGPGRTANVNNLVPVLAFTISYFLLSEQLLPIQFIGAGITVVGVWIARR